MNSRENDVLLKKSTQKDNNSITDMQRKKIIKKLMDDYNVSEKKAKNILIKIEKKGNLTTHTKNSTTKNTNQSTETKPKFHKNNEKKETHLKTEQYTPLMIEKTSVDNIVSDLIPDYNKNISIELKHVNLIFDVETDQIDTLKEYVIRTLKRNKSKKIKFQALKDISFKIYKGEKVGIIGYNGAGKSTLLKVICGIYEPNEGIVETNGNISPLLSLGAGFDRNYSGRKNILLNGAVLGYSKSYLESKIDEIIEFTDLGEFIDIPIRNYSSGMLAKLGFSIATIVEPDILIIDEILSVGDVTFAKKSSDKIKSLINGGATVILVSHSIPQIREICDKAIWIDKGRVREIGEVNKVCDSYIKDSEKANNEQLANIKFR